MTAANPHDTAHSAAVAPTLTVAVIRTPAPGSDVAVARFLERFLAHERPGTTWNVRA
jgi:hypothetical protein